MTAPVVVLNGGSSSGTTSIARALQRLLGPTWMTLGVDDLVRALPGGEEIDDRVRPRPHSDEPAWTDGPLRLGSDGSVSVGEDFRRAEAAWYAGLAAIGRSGTGLIVDEVFLDGASSKARLEAALSGLVVVWVGVRCAPEVAAARERRRPDRVPGMASLQADRVHEGVAYDLVVDTTSTSAAECARVIASRLSPGGR
ncbi:MAG TPA: hypothetical protein VFN50_06540 [Acidimicrobiales bacterium]|nr:hypothetical protein [Acidimicrobiales bacterium]